MGFQQLRTTSDLAGRSRPGRQVVPTRRKLQTTRTVEPDPGAAWVGKGNIQRDALAERFRPGRAGSADVRGAAQGEVVLSYWNDLEHGNKLRKNGVRIPESCPKPGKHTHLRKETCGTAVSKLHGRAPNPRARQRGGARARGGWRLPVCGEHFYDFWYFSGVSPES